MFWNPCYKTYKFCYIHIFSFGLHVNPRKRINKYALIVLGVVLNNFMWFLARMCPAVLLVLGKNLNPF